ncbi:MAG: hypothetical protein K1X74_14190 [Pirellulales bacterium]|nr:hypothetical protein [Pirellulales bacterium]
MPAPQAFAITPDQIKRRKLSPAQVAFLIEKQNDARLRQCGYSVASKAGRALLRNLNTASERISAVDQYSPRRDVRAHGRFPLRKLQELQIMKTSSRTLASRSANQPIARVYFLERLSASGTWKVVCVSMKRSTLIGAMQATREMGAQARIRAAWAFAVA